jgi:hypothetical protein
MSFPNDRTYSFDANLILADNAAAYTASGVSQVGGVATTLDLGGNQGTSPAELARIDAVAVIDVTAIKVSAGNETYKLLINASNDPNFGAGNVINVGAIELNAAASDDVPNSAASVTGRYEVMFCTQQAGNIYEFLQLYLVAGGTLPSISISAFVAVLPEP